MKFILENTFGLICAMLTIPLVFFVIFNLGGMLFGFEKQSDGCKSYMNKTQSNISYYFMPITPYACQKNGGLLQPAISNFIEWLGETH